MLIFNIPKNCSELISEIQETFDNSELVEVDSLGADTVIQVIVPIITVAIPAVASIVVKAISVSSKVEIEWNGIKVKGNQKQVEKFFNKLYALDNKNTKSPTKKGKSS